MFRIAICDDSETDRRSLEFLLHTCAERRGVDCAFTHYMDGAVLCDDYQDGDADFDLVFLDICMTHVSGIETARRIRALGSDTPVVFLTSSPDFAVESYEVVAFDYLLKPISPERLEQTMGRFFALHSTREAESLLVTSRGHGRRIPYGDILYIESMHNHVIIHCVGGATHSLRISMSEVERELLTRPNFLKTHQSYLINMDKVTAVDGEFTVEGGDRVPIKVRERRRIRERYFEYALSIQQEVNMV